MADTLILTEPNTLEAEVARRRTFAIISHPDAGKTTLTEKLLLYGGAVTLAGSVRARKNQRRATSDWMKMEQERGISITSTVLQFPYDGHTINLLDTPGHQDFSEDTYRTLVAVDSAVMVIDAARGIEAQTLKLFQVCRRRGIPILTFINKMDRPTRDPFELLDEIEKVLRLQPVPMNWPIGSGDDFRGVYDRRTRRVHLFERGETGKKAVALQVEDPSDPKLLEVLSERSYNQLQEDIELLDIAGAEFDHAAMERGELTPVFFGSALTNFGVELFFDSFVELAPPPGPRRSDGRLVYPTDGAASGFIFKIQSNMNPQHRDSVAFVRVCSGRFERDMVVEHARTGKPVRLSRAQRFFAQERETVEEAYPGDVIGLPNPGVFAIGDTICTGTPVEFEPLPRFAPEHFARLSNRDTNRYKQFNKGLAQLEAEGALQVLYEPDAFRREPILAAVGRLQFDVVQFRLKSEYDVETTLEVLPYSTARIVEADPATIEKLPWGATLRTVDRDGRTMALFASEWSTNYWKERYADARLIEIGAEAGL
ncbi:MAG TPA: peptide chain release factor 3 [Ardenticatenaceae bacterium]|nr:peptide chain release factor 3 [Ardenticatenaceae bacterium]